MLYKTKDTENIIRLGWHLKRNLNKYISQKDHMQVFKHKAKKQELMHILLLKICCKAYHFRTSANICMHIETMCELLTSCIKLKANVQIILTKSTLQGNKVIKFRERTIMKLQPHHHIYLPHKHINVPITLNGLNRYRFLKIQQIERQSLHKIT